MEGTNGIMNEFRTEKYDDNNFIKIYNSSGKMNQEFLKELMELFVKHNIVPSSVVTELRNIEIRSRYIILKNELGSKLAMEKLSEEYFTSTDNIDRIVYPRNK